MKFCIAGLLLFSSFITSFSQQEVIYETGIMGAFRDATSILKYPPDDRRKGICGTVLLKFRARIDKSIDSISVLSSATTAMDAEAIRGLQNTSGRWLVIDNRYYLITFTFKLSPPDATGDEHYRRYVDQELKAGNDKRALKGLVELKRRNPTNTALLDELADVYHRLGDTENETAIRLLKDIVLKFRNEKRIIGEGIPRE